MNKMTEKEIFDYVFFAKDVDKSIEKNVEQIDFYKKLKNTIEEKLSPDIKNKLMDKILIYKPVTRLILIPFEEPKPNSAPLVERLAADSDNSKEEISTRTFIDKEKNIIIRQVTKNGESNLFVFSVENQELKNFRLVIHPPKTEIECIDNAAPIAVDTDLQIEKIEIEIE